MKKTFVTVNLMGWGGGNLCDGDKAVNMTNRMMS